MLPSCHSARRACMPEVAGFTLDQESSVLGFCDFAFRLCAEWQHFERFPESSFWRLRTNSQMLPSCHTARRACMPEVAESTICSRIFSTWILRLRLMALRRMTAFWEVSWIQVFWRLGSNAQMHPSCRSSRRACVPEVAESTIFLRILSTWILRLRLSSPRRMTAFWNDSF